MKKHNFSAGPSILPKRVFEEAAAGVLDLNSTGLSILEISHRSKAFEEIMAKTKMLIRSLLNLSEQYEILFLSGGASSQFFMVPMNLARHEDTVSYIDSGSWSSKAIKEAKRFCKVEVAASSQDLNYSYIPKSFKIADNSSYLHITSNNTIYGTQYHSYPECAVPIIADMSSDIFCRPLQMNRFGLIYAGAQKNMGPAGVTMVIIRNDMVDRINPDLPTMLNYKTHISKDSMFNTPPVFPIYVSMLNLQWLADLGGLENARRRNEEKAQLLYDEIDRNGLFAGLVAKEDRSLMNVTFVLNNTENEAAFLDMCKVAECVGVKGHRSAGGFRASIYNAMPLDSVAVLVDVMKEFEEKFG